MNALICNCGAHMLRDKNVEAANPDKPCISFYCPDCGHTSQFYADLTLIEAMLKVKFGDDGIYDVEPRMLGKYKVGETMTFRRKKKGD